MGDRRRNIVTAAGKDGFVPAPVGLPGKSLNANQRTSLISLLGEYVGDLPEPFAQQRLKELSSEIDKMSFAWWGAAEKGGDFSYRLQGPSIIIEYAGQDLGGILMTICTPCTGILPTNMVPDWRSEEMQDG